MKWLFAGLCVLLCLSADPVATLTEPFSLLQTSNQPADAQGLTLGDTGAE